MRSLAPGRRTISRWEWALLCVAALLALGQALEGVKGDHALSRLATVYSLASYGSWYIDNPSGLTPNPFEPQTIDKVMVRGVVARGVISGGRIISSKPPLLPLIMTGEYLVLNRVFGWDLDREADLDSILLVMTVSLVGAAYLLSLVFFLKTLYLLDIPAWVRLYLLAALAFGAELWGFSGKMSNHVPAAGLLTVSVYLAIGLCAGLLKPAPWRFALFGLTGALTATFDMPMGIFVFACGLALLIRHPGRTLVWVSVGAALPLLLHLAIMWRVTGSVLPVQVRKETYFFETSYWRHPLGIDALREPKGTYLFHITLGRAGIFALFPVLLTGPAAALRALFRRGCPWRAAILSGALSFAALTFYYVTRTSNYGGESYGFRWFIGAMPMLLLMGAPLVARMRRPWQLAFLMFLLAVSIYSGWECSRTDWQSGQEWTAKIFGPPYEQFPGP